jgi:formamidopyrimidine-DNA glycosylase
LQEILTRQKNRTIKQALMEQKYLAGLGNIYSDETLFAARIRPTRIVKTLSAEEIKKLWQAIPRVLRYSIKHRGTSFSDYVDVEGEIGNFIKYLKVYGRAGEKCRDCGSLIKKIKIGGRSSHFCEKCQK